MCLSVLCQQELTCLMMFFTFTVLLKNFLPRTATADLAVTWSRYF